ncbi:hypothetical protein CPB84DRAFT_1029550 [Gymnopilus junonius]|uniref:Uncharacterized protein n=1 Tax=Gymnopilus junonius TaxID=109634 RepID=A0A9P5NPL4_GYMJU|nr:hypothetical protein CPB84DRAFT_1029550 [Gymnopilus junonius]
MHGRYFEGSRLSIQVFTTVITASLSPSPHSECAYSGPKTLLPLYGGTIAAVPHPPLSALVTAKGLAALAGVTIEATGTLSGTGNGTVTGTTGLQRGGGAVGLQRENNGAHLLSTIGAGTTGTATVNGSGSAARRLRRWWQAGRMVMWLRVRMGRRKVVARIGLRPRHMIIEFPLLSFFLFSSPSSFLCHIL